MLPLDTYHLLGHRLVNDERDFGRQELRLQREKRDDIFGLQYMRRVGRPNQDLKAALLEGASGRGCVLVQTF